MLPTTPQTTDAASIQTTSYDVVVIGAGGAGLRAAIEPHDAGARTADRLQVAARQGAHRHGRGRHRGRDGQRLARGQLEGALPRHDARRQDAQQLAHGPAARPGGARPRLRARGVGRAVRPHQGRPDLPARLRRPPLRAPRARRRPHRPGADPHAAAARRALGIDVFMECTVRGCSRTATAIAGAFGYWRETGRVRGLPGPGGRARHRRHRQGVPGHVELLGVHRRRPRAGAAGRRAR